MACCRGGYRYREDRFQTSIAKNFICELCKGVLKDPVQCHNEHYFCKACITRHLKNSKTCPVCTENLTEEMLSKPPRILTNILNALIINCDHSERGCTELIELVRLEAHSRTCNYKPVTCPNEKCAKIMNLADLEQHKSDVCEYRQVYCEECEKEMPFKKYSKHSCVTSKDVHAMKASLIQVQHQVKEMFETQKEMSKAQKEMFEAIQNLTADAKARDEIPQGNIVVVGGIDKSNYYSPNTFSSVEMYSLANRTWSELAPMQEKRESPTAHLCNGRVMVTGGVEHKTTEYDGALYHAKKSIEYIQIPQLINEAHSDEFSSFVSQLPIECFGHKTAMINNYLWMVGGINYDQTDDRNKQNNKAQYLDTIYTIPIKSPLTHIVKCQMPKPLAYHCLEILNGNELLITGGSTTGMSRDVVDAVLLYNTVTNTLQEMHPLPFPMSHMATVKHGEDVIIIGGQNKDGQSLNTVFKYNCKKNECDQLPGMKHRRSQCAAVISGNKVFVMGGHDQDSVECFDINYQVWHELPSMRRKRFGFAAVLVP